MFTIIKFIDLNLIKLSHCFNKLYVKNNYVLLYLPKNSFQNLFGDLQTET